MSQVVTVCLCDLAKISHVGFHVALCDCSIEFPPMRVMSKKRKRKTEEAAEQEAEGEEKPVLEVTPYQIPNRGPYPFNQPKK